MSSQKGGSERRDGGKSLGQGCDVMRNIGDLSEAHLSVEWMIWGYILAIAGKKGRDQDRAWSVYGPLSRLGMGHMEF